MNNNNVTDEGVSAPPPPTDSVTAINMNITDLRSIAALGDPSITGDLLSLNLHMNNLKIVDFNVFASPERHHASQIPNSPSTPADTARQASAQSMAVNVGQVMVPTLPRPLPFSSLVELNLSANSITALHGFVLLASLRKLNLSGNGITSVALAAMSFQSCPLMWRSLRHLDLSHNVISSLEYLGSGDAHAVTSDAEDTINSRSPRTVQAVPTQSAERLKPKPARASAFGRTIDSGAPPAVPTGPTDSTGDSGSTAALPSVTLSIALEWLDLSGNHLSAVEAMTVLQQCSKLTVLRIAPKLVRGSTSPPAAASRGVSSSAPTTRVQSYRQETSPRTHDRLSDERPDRTPSRREAVDSAVTDGSPGSAYDADPFAVLDRSDPFASAPNVETPRQLTSGREASGEMGNGLGLSESPSPRVDGARGAEEQVCPLEAVAGLRSEWTWAAESFAVLQRSANRYNTDSASGRSPEDPISGERERAVQPQRSSDNNAVTRSPLYFRDVVALLPQLWILDGRMTRFDTQHPAPVGSLAPPALKADIVRSSAEFPLLSAWVTAARAEAATHRAESEDAIRRALLGPPHDEGAANSIQHPQQRQRLGHDGRERGSAVRAEATNVQPPQPRGDITSDESDERPNPLLDTLAPRQVPHRRHQGHGLPRDHQASPHAQVDDGATRHEVSSVVAASTITPDDGTVGAAMPAADVSSETPPSSNSHRSVTSADVAREENYLLKQLLEQLLQERASHQLSLQQLVEAEQQRSGAGEEVVSSSENQRTCENATQTTEAGAASSPPLHHSSGHPSTAEDDAEKKTCQRCSDAHVAMERWRSEALSAIAALRNAEAEAEHRRDAAVAAEHAHRRETDHIQREFAELTKVREAAHAAAIAAESEKHAATLRQHEQNVASRIADACTAVRLEIAADESTLAEQHSSRSKEEQSRFLDAQAEWKGREERITVQNDELRKDALTWQQEVVRLSQTLQSSQALSEERAADAHKHAAHARDLQSTVDEQRVTISKLNHELKENQFTSASLQERLIAADQSIDAKIKIAMEGVVKSERAAAARSMRTVEEQLHLKAQECHHQRSEIDVLRAQLADSQAAQARFTSSSAMEVRRLRETVRSLETEAMSTLLHRDQETARTSVMEEESSARVALMLQVISHRPMLVAALDARTVASAAATAAEVAPSEKQQRQAELVLALSNENADLRRASVDHHATLAALQRTVANLKESLERRDGEVAAVEDEAWVKIDEKRKENAALESELSDLKRHNERLVTELRDTAALLRKTMQEVQAQHAVADASTKVADEHLRERDRALETLRNREAQLQRSEEHRQWLKGSVRTMLKDREEAASFFREWKRQQAVTEEALAAKARELTTLKSKIRTISSDD